MREMAPTAEARWMAVEPSDACLSRAAPACRRRLTQERWTPLWWMLGGGRGGGECREREREREGS